MTGGILALDLARETGWAYAGQPALESWPRTPLEAASAPALLFDVGTKEFPRTGHDVGKFASRYDRWLREQLGLWRPGQVAFEAPYVDWRTSQAAARKLMGLAWHTEWVCHCLEIWCQEVDVADIRGHFIGRRNCKRAVAKDLVMKACEQRGWAYANDNEADAMALLDYAVACWRPALRRAQGEGVAA